MTAHSDKIVKHFVGIVAFVLIGVGAAILYLLIVGKLLGRGGDGFGLTAALFMFPILACTTGVLCWLPLWLLHNHRWGPMPALRALLLGAFIGALVSMVIAGPGGFLLRGGAPLFNYFLILILALGGLVHNRVMARPGA
jgi:hypothetical protein